MSTFAPQGVRVWGSNTPKKALGHIILDTKSLNSKRLRGSNTIISPYSNVGRTVLSDNVGAAPVKLSEPSNRPFNVGALRGHNKMQYPTINAWTAEKARALVPEEEEPTKVEGISARTMEKVRPSLSADDLASSIKMALETMEESPQTDKLKMMLKAIGQIQLIAKKRPLMEAEQDILRDIENELVLSAEAEPAMKSAPIAKARAAGEEEAALESRSEMSRVINQLEALKENEDILANNINELRQASRDFKNELKGIKKEAIDEDLALRDDMMSAQLAIRSNEDAIDELDNIRTELIQRMDKIQAKVAKGTLTDKDKAKAQQIVENMKKIEDEIKTKTNDFDMAMASFRLGERERQKVRKNTIKESRRINAERKKAEQNIKKNIGQIGVIEAKADELGRIGQAAEQRALGAEEKAEEIMAEAENYPEPLAERKEDKKQRIIKKVVKPLIKQQSDDLVGLLKSILKKEAQTGNTQAGQLLQMGKDFEASAEAKDEEDDEAQTIRQEDRTYSERAESGIRSIEDTKGNKETLQELFLNITGQRAANSWTKEKIKAMLRKTAAVLDKAVGSETARKKAKPEYAAASNVF